MLKETIQKKKKVVLNNAVVHHVVRLQWQRMLTVNQVLTVNPLQSLKMIQKQTICLTHWTIGFLKLYYNLVTKYCLIKFVYGRILW